MSTTKATTAMAPPGIDRAEMALVMSVMRASTRDTLDRLVEIRRQPKLGEPMTESGAERWSQRDRAHSDIWGAWGRLSDEHEKGSADAAYDEMLCAAYAHAVALLPPHENAAATLFAHTACTAYLAAGVHRAIGESAYLDLTHDWCAATEGWLS
jgi:hypothetical protein